MGNYNGPVMSVPVPTLDDRPDLNEFLPYGNSVQDLLLERQTLIKAKDDSEYRIAEIDIALGTAQDLAGIKNVVWEGLCPKEDCNGKHLVMRREASKGRETLDRVRLLEAGVTPIQLAAGTKMGKSGKGGITVRHLSEKGMEREEDPFQ